MDDDLYYYRARYYDPTVQRFLSEDPIGFSSGDFNFYRYVLGNPIGLTDPFRLTVYLCKSPVLGVEFVDHYWIKTDTLERGMWNAWDAWFPNIPILAKVAVRDEDYNPDALCREIPYVDEAKVNNQLKLYRQLGHWYPCNECQSFAHSVLENAKDGVQNYDNHVTDPYFRPWVPRSSI